MKWNENEQNAKAEEGHIAGTYCYKFLRVAAVLLGWDFFLEGSRAIQCQNDRVNMHLRYISCLGITPVESVFTDVFNQGSQIQDKSML